MNLASHRYSSFEGKGVVSSLCITKQKALTNVGSAIVPMSLCKLGRRALRAANMLPLPILVARLARALIFFVLSSSSSSSSACSTIKLGQRQELPRMETVR